MIALYNATNGPNWLNNTNWLSDKPLHKWHGVEATTNLDAVLSLYLHTKRLTGTIPSELGNLSSLRNLEINHNNLTGELPSSLTNLPSLINFRFHSNAGLCAPTDAAFQNWLQEIATKNGPNCSSAQTSAPGAPTGLAATADGQTKIDLSWTAPSDDGDADITGYRIEVSTNGSSWSDLVADTGNTSTSYSHTGLGANSTRHYRVSAINSAGTGTASGTDSATTDEASAEKPGAPTGLTATADGQTEIDLSWSAPPSDGGASISGYKIEVSTNGSSWSDLVADTGSASTTYSHTGLSAGSTRHYRVSAINSEGTGQASSTDSATTESRTNAAPTAVGTIPVQVIILGTQLTLDVSPYFNDPDGDTLGYSISSPQLFNSESVSGSTVTLLLSTSIVFCDSTTVTVTAQDPGGLEVSQTFTLKRVNNAPTVSSGTFPAQTIDVGEGSRLGMSNWFSDQDTCDSRLTFTADSSDTVKVSVSSSGSNVTITGEAAGSATVTVTATDSASASATLTIQVTVMALLGKPSAPRSLTATADGQTEIDLSWTAPSDDGGSAITGYSIWVSSDGADFSELVANTGSSSTSYTHTGLSAGSTRHYWVMAINSVGIGRESNAVSATTDSAPAPTQTDDECVANLSVQPGDNCTYPGTTEEFSVDASGTGQFLFFSSGTKLEIRNTNINGVVYTLVASNQADGSWLIDEVG